MYNKYRTFDQAMELLAKDRRNRKDILATVGEMRPTVHEGSLVFEHNGKKFSPTPFAAEQAGTWAGCGSWIVKNLSTPFRDHNDRVKYYRDDKDAVTLAAVLKNGFRRIDKNKKFLWRTSGSSLRAMLSDQYSPITNEWFLEAVHAAIPDATFPHWRGDCDTVWATVAVPETTRIEHDSEYVGVFSVGNSEIGERKLGLAPGVCRDVSKNSVVVPGDGRGKLEKVHRGAIDLTRLAQAVKSNVSVQIPLLTRAVDKFLRIRSHSWGTDTILPLFAQVAIDAKLTKSQAKDLTEAYNAERRLTPEYARTLFGVVNGITRAGQNYDPPTWVRFDQLGGSLACIDEKEWSRLASRARSLGMEEVEKVFLQLE